MYWEVYSPKFFLNVLRNVFVSTHNNAAIVLASQILSSTSLCRLSLCL